MDKKEILKELEKEFENMKNDLGFKATLDELDGVFFVRDFVLGDGFVSDSLSRRLAHRISDTYMSWIHYLHGLLSPQPGNLLAGIEGKPFGEDERKEIWKLIVGATELSSRNSLIGLTKDKTAEGAFIDDSLMFWNEIFQPKLIEIVGKINEAWSEGKSS